LIEAEVKGAAALPPQRTRMEPPQMGMVHVGRSGLELLGREAAKWYVHDDRPAGVVVSELTASCYRASPEVWKRGQLEQGYVDVLPSSDSAGRLIEPGRRLERK
jgi:hypothetical protein